MREPESKRPLGQVSGDLQRRWVAFQNYPHLPMGASAEVTHARRSVASGHASPVCSAGWTLRQQVPAQVQCRGHQGAGRVLPPNHKSPFRGGSPHHAAPPDCLEVPRDTSWCLRRGGKVCHAGLVRAHPLPGAPARTPSGWVLAWELSCGDRRELSVPGPQVRLRVSRPATEVSWDCGHIAELPEPQSPRRPSGLAMTKVDPKSSW